MCTGVTLRVLKRLQERLHISGGLHGRVNKKI